MAEGFDACSSLLFKEKGPNPLVSRFRAASTYYFSLSFDLNVAKAFRGGLGGLFGSGT